MVKIMKTTKKMRQRAKTEFQEAASQKSSQFQGTRSVLDRLKCSCLRDTETVKDCETSDVGVRCRCQKIPLSTSFKKKISNNQKVSEDKIELFKEK